MKRYLMGIILLLVFAACSKTETPPPVNKGNNSTNNNSGNGNDPSGGNGGNTNTGGNTGTSNNVGNVTNYNGYVVKTVGISRIRFAVDNNEKLTVAELVGGGNHIVLRAGNQNKASFTNDKASVAVEQYTDAFPDAKFSVSEEINNSKVLDTTGVVLRLTGFDKAKMGFNQVNLVLCREVAVTSMYNVAFMNLQVFLARNQYNNEYFKKVFTTPVNVSTLKLADPSEKYITRDVVSSGINVNILESGVTNLVDAYDTWGTSMIKIRFSNSGALNVGGLLKAELINAEKGQLSYKSYELNGTHYDPTFSNLIKSSLETVVEAPDTSNNVFLRVTGFDPKICGYNQLRIFLMQDYYHKDAAPIGFISIKKNEKYTLQQIKDYINVKDRYCIRLSTQ